MDAGSSLSLLANAYIQDFDVNLQNYKVGIPIGLYGSTVLPISPTKVEAYYSDFSVQLLSSTGAGIPKDLPGRIGCKSGGKAVNNGNP